MHPRRSNLTLTLAIVASVAMSLLLVAEKYATRPAFVLLKAGPEVTVDGKPGGVATVVFNIERVRDECRLVPHLMNFEVIDSAGESYIINQRSGISNNLPEGMFERLVRFEVPRFAASGPAVLEIHGVMTCEWPFGISWRVYQSLPRLSFNVIGADDE